MLIDREPNQTFTACGIPVGFSSSQCEALRAESVPLAQSISQFLKAHYPTPLNQSERIFDMVLGSQIRLSYSNSIPVFAEMGLSYLNPLPAILERLSYPLLEKHLWVVSLTIYLLPSHQSAEVWMGTSGCTAKSSKRY